MGNLRAREMAGAAASGELSLYAALHYHLTANHYPPYRPTFVPLAERVIAHAKAGRWGKLVRLPANIWYRGERAATVRDLVDAMHLAAFVGTEEGY